MRRTLSILSLICAFVICAHAETLILRTGARVRGEIVFQNDEVVILRDADGARFQYPRTDVLEILADESATSTSQDPETSTDEITTSKKISILLELAGGVAVNPNEAVGGAFSVDLLVGTHHIADRHLFVGGGLGYHGLFFGADKFNFLPIQAAVRIPFTESKHAPVAGLAIGYGVALSKNYLGGLYASADIGYRYQINPHTAVAVVAFAQFQQAKIHLTETMDSEPFVNYVGRNFLIPGIKIVLYF